MGQDLRVYIEVPEEAKVAVIDVGDGRVGLQATKCTV
ncbi:uncharacterized protein G2W53_035383 [Senna tora]|uniref:Uncharacterized protein n=1 Tax=Senna tora TaxID=362788 RepID=A0A834W3Z0_9FABA|nr:uncharacterized protein G2W53_035383 [Senna tora]